MYNITICKSVLMYLDVMTAFDTLNLLKSKKNAI